MRLGNASLSLGAAVDGLGIALGDTILADADLAAGRLVAPFDIRVAAPGAYFLLLPPGAHRAGTREAVATWLADRLTAGSPEVRSGHIRRPVGSTPCPSPPDDGATPHRHPRRTRGTP